MLSFSEKTISISINTNLCQQCKSKACIKACSKYARGIIQLKNGIPDLSHLTQSEIKRLGNECLACEYECRFRGENAIEITIPIKGLDC